ncbi:hypothetical protein NP233_g3660 [Leucocoprinus birnbaumii]|uniref:LIM zinc-binding domain-containing protein n=1 Tax=Leucocoprinus birnbaumii TaxID=56174 RepID=A0AAD5W2P8_9AGAR|nr:hypothetical protein NP233_g3660 [Leucocoprinus birnbaumii]
MHCLAPTVSWNQSNSQEDQDKWSQTYVSREKSVSPVRPKSRGPPENTSSSLAHSENLTARRFPRAIGAQITGSTLLDDRITNHITSTTSQLSRSVSPLKPSVTGPKPESGILPSLIPNDTTLSKVYGSVLQPRESLTTHSCASCSTPFLPDATIYPDPSIPADDEPRFLCRQCFIVGGGSKGLCPNCDKPVTILKAEGGFVYAADKYWHKKCFNCEGCSKNIGDSPMVDLLGRPSCPDCFDTCLSREPRTPKRSIEKQGKSSVSPEKRSVGGWDISSNTTPKFRESSPAIEELEQRLGIGRSREGSPALEELSQRLSSIGRDFQPRYSSPSSPLQSRSGRMEGSPSPVRQLERLRSVEPEESVDGGSSSVFGSPRRSSGSPAPTTEAIDEMKRRFLRQSTASPTLSTVTLLESSPAMSSSLRSLQTNASPRHSLNSRIPLPITRAEPTSPTSSTPDFMSDISDSLTQSSLSGVDSPPTMNELLFDQPPPRYSRTDLLSNPDDVIPEETKSQMNTPSQTPQSTIRIRSSTMGTPSKTPTKSPLTKSNNKVIGSVSVSSTCVKCERPLFASKEGGKFVTVPGEDESDASQTFHRECFRCTYCEGVFNETAGGQAIFVKSSAGPAHVECAPPEKIVVRKSPSAGSLRFSHERASLRTDSSPTKSPSPSQRHSFTSSRYERPPPTAPATTTSFPRFGSRSSCPGCQKSVSPMERNVIPGPQGSRWHSDCLVCGGKRPPSKSSAWMLGRGEEKKKEPGCGKRLDSAAKTDATGRIWCRECLLILGVGGSPQTLPTRQPSASVSIGASGKLSQQLSGTTLARQFTGLGGSGNSGEVDLLRQLTGGSNSPTRSLSPTKQLGTGTRPRPKSPPHPVLVKMTNSPWPLSLALDEDQAFEAVLSDIPFFCVGLMAMGFVTFTFALKRMDSTVLYLCSASLLLFMAAVLDLGQLLIRGPSGGGQNFDSGVVSGFIVAREVGLGLAYGFLFLFVWRAVAVCPSCQNERPKSLVRPMDSSTSIRTHSASWARWGHLGAVLKWFTLALIIVIPLLQILWRLISSQRQYSSIYIADSVLEIVASAIFVLKIILNVLVSPSESWWIPFKYYFGLVLGLVVTGAMGIGNLISFAFSETILGRFLRAIGVYVFLLWNLVTLFQRRDAARRVIDDQEAPAVLPSEKSKERIMNKEDMGPSRTRERTPSMVTLGHVMQSPEARPTPLRISTTSRLSMIVNRVDQSDALAEITRSISTRSSRRSPVTPVTPKRPRRPDLRFDIITPTLPATAENPDEEPPTTGISLSYYTMNTSLPDVPVIRDPPVNPTKPSLYQADEQGNMEYTSQTSIIAQPPSHNASLSSFDELMRQQNELDQSIAKLKLLSVDNVDLPPLASTLSPVPENSSTTGDTAASTKSRPQSTPRTVESTSPRSEFSFSAFPIPPPRPESIRVSRFTNSTIRKLPQPPDQTSSQVAPMLTVPESPVNMFARMTSGATQYDVTSFIDNLTEPAGMQRSTSTDEGPQQDSELRAELQAADDGLTQAEEDQPPPVTVAPDDSSSVAHLKPMLLPSVASERKAAPLPTLRPIRNTRPPAGQRDSTLKPFLLGTSISNVPPSLPSSTMIPLGSRRSSRATRVPTHKPQISAPRMNISGDLDEEDPAIYERPRPPPILIGLPDRPRA